MKKRLGVLISGSGTNLQALIDACAAPDFPAEIALVISNKADAYGLERAKKAGIKTAYFNHKDYPTREAFDAEMDKALRAEGIELVCLAGFMRLLSGSFVGNWYGRMINIHPSLLPAFKGAHAQRDALNAGVKLAGCTVHFVVPEMDAGPIIAQGAVAVSCDDDEASLRAKVLEVEHACFVYALKQLASGSIRIEDNLVRVLGADAPKGMLLSF